MPRPSVYRKIAYTFLALTVVVVLAVLWLTSVRAEVVVKVRREPIRLDGTVEVAKEPAPGQIKGRVVQGTFEKIQEFQVSEPASSSAPAPEPEPGRLPDDKVAACGDVRIVNTYSRTQPLVERTRLLTADNKLYRITKGVTVPAKGEVKVRACADKPGYAYVIGPSRFTIPGLFIDLQAFIYAVSDAPMTAEPIENTPLANAPAQPAPAPTAPAEPTKKVTAVDLENAERTLTDIVLARAKSDLSAEAGNPSDHEVVYVVKVVDKKSNVSIGQAAETFLYSVKLDVTAVYYPKEDMQLLVRNRLRERVPEGREFVPVEGGAVTYSLESADKAAEVASIRITAEGAYRLGASSPLLQPSVIAGKSKDEAVAILKAIEGVEDAQITIRPSWLSTVPALKDKVQITVE